MIKYLFSLCILVSLSSFAQEKTMAFEEYDPISTLIVPEHIVKKAKFPFIDIHNHQNNMPSQDLGYLVKQMDSLNMKVMINLSGKGSLRSGAREPGTDYLIQSVHAGKEKANGRVIVFTNLNFSDIDNPNLVCGNCQGFRKRGKGRCHGIKNI
jgi:hypothetical protein